MTINEVNAMVAERLREDFEVSYTDEEEESNEEVDEEEVDEEEVDEEEVEEEVSYTDEEDEQ